MVILDQVRLSSEDDINNINSRENVLKMVMNNFHEPGYCETSGRELVDSLRGIPNLERRDSRRDVLLKNKKYSDSTITHIIKSHSIIYL